MSEPLFGDFPDPLISAVFSEALGSTHAWMIRGVNRDFDSYDDITALWGEVLSVQVAYLGPSHDTNIHFAAEVRPEAAAQEREILKAYVHSVAQAQVGAVGLARIGARIWEGSTVEDLQAWYMNECAGVEPDLSLLAAHVLGHEADGDGLLDAIAFPHAISAGMELLVEPLEALGADAASPTPSAAVLGFIAASSFLDSLQEFQARIVASAR